MSPPSAVRSADRVSSSAPASSRPVPSAGGLRSMSSAGAASTSASAMPRLLSGADPVMLPRVTTRGERLANALRRGFISARVLHLRAGPPALSELIGPMAPERYLALPRRSVVAARAMIAVALAKGDRDVARLETFRRSGSLRATSGKPIDEQQNDGTPREWFDEVTAALLGHQPGDAIEDAIDTLKELEIGPNKSYATLRRAQMPAEAFRLDATGGVDYTESTAPARDADNDDLVDVVVPVVPNVPVPNPVPVAVPVKPIETVDVDSPPPAEPLPPAQPQDMLFPELDIEDRPPLAEVNVAEPNVEDQVTDPTDAMDIDSTGKSPPSAKESQTQPLVNVVDIDDPVDAAPLSGPASAPVGVAPELQTTPEAEKKTSPNNLKNAEGTALDRLDTTPEGACSVVGKKGTHFSLWLIEKDKEKFSIDFNIEGKPSPNVTKASVDPLKKSAEMEVVELDGIPTVDLRSDCEAEDAEAGYHVRQDGPVGMLQEMLHTLNNKEPSPKRPSARPAPQGTEVVCIDINDEGEHGKQAVSPTPKRLRKRKMGSFVRSGRKQIEERRARIMSAVVQTMQEDPETAKKQTPRASPGVANGHRITHSRKGEDREKRSTRPSRKSIPLLEFSDDERTKSKDPDEDFEVDDGDDSAVEIPLLDRAPPPKTAPPLSPPPPRVNPAPRVTRSAHHHKRSPEATEKSKKTVEQRIDEPNDIIEPPKRQEESQKEVQPMWEREIARINKAIASNDTGSPSLSSSEEDIETEMLHESVPNLRRLMEPVRDGDRCLSECDLFTEHDSMMQFYRDTRNDPPYAPSANSPGTAFYLETWKQRHSRSGMRLSAPDPDEELEGDVFEDRASLALNRFTGTGAIAAVGDFPSRISSDSSDASSVRSYSSDGDGDGDREMNGEKGHRRGRTSRAVRARELQNRVCGDLLSGMSAEAKRRVLRWAEKDYSWFDDGTDMMEIVASRVVKSCPECDKRDGKYNDHCEESILLILWTNMTWRKVRRMRHRVRSASN